MATINATRLTEYKILCHVYLSRTDLEIERYWTLKFKLNGVWRTAIKQTDLDFLREYLPSVGVDFNIVPQQTYRHH